MKMLLQSFKFVCFLILETTFFLLPKNNRSGIWIAPHQWKLLKNIFWNWVWSHFLVHVTSFRSSCLAHLYLPMPIRFAFVVCFLSLASFQWSFLNSVVFLHFKTSPFPQLFFFYSAITYLLKLSVFWINWFEWNITKSYNDSLTPSRHLTYSFNDTVATTAFVVWHYCFSGCWTACTNNNSRTYCTNEQEHQQYISLKFEYLGVWPLLYRMLMFKPYFFNFDTSELP